MSQSIYVIMCNDYPKAVADTDEADALQITARLALAEYEHISRSGPDNYGDYITYRRRVYWRPMEVPVVV